MDEKTYKLLKDLVATRAKKDQLEFYRDKYSISAAQHDTLDLLYKKERELWDEIEGNLYLFECKLNNPEENY
jgi:hypothetical protein